MLKKLKDNLERQKEPLMVEISFLPKAAILEYQKLSKKSSGLALSFDEALRKAESLLGFYNAVVYGKKFEFEKEVVSENKN